MVLLETRWRSEKMTSTPNQAMLSTTINRDQKISLLYLDSRVSLQSTHEIGCQENPHLDTRFQFYNGLTLCRASCNGRQWTCELQTPPKYTDRAVYVRLNKSHFERITTQWANTVGNPVAPMDYGPVRLVVLFTRNVNQIDEMPSIELNRSQWDCFTVPYKGSRHWILVQNFHPPSALVSVLVPPFPFNAFSFSTSNSKAGLQYPGGHYSIFNSIQLQSTHFTVISNRAKQYFYNTLYHYIRLFTASHGIFSLFDFGTSDTPSLAQPRPPSW